MSLSDAPRHGGCRSFVVSGCLIAFGLCLLAFAAVVTVAVVLIRLVLLGLSYL